MTEKEKLEQALVVVQEKLGEFIPLIAITLGTGLGYMVDLLENAKRCPYSEIPNCPIPSVKGHKGELWWGWLKGVPVIMMRGRVHLYEDRSVHEVVFLTRLMIMFGIEWPIITHATGAVTRNLEPGDIVGVWSQIGLNCPDPTSGPGIDKLGRGPFTSMEDVLDPELLALAKRCALQEGVSFHRGVSHFKRGRTFETPAETTAMARNGADVATMSTVPEVMAAAQMSVKPKKKGGRWRRPKVLDLALVTDMCPGLGGPKVDHEEVLRVAEANKGPFGRLITAIVAEMGKLN